MPVATITAKGQITIPKIIRDALGLRLGDQVVFTVQEGKAVLRPVHLQGLPNLRGIARGRAQFVDRATEREAAHSSVVRHSVGRSVN